MHLKSLVESLTREEKESVLIWKVGGQGTRRTVLYIILGAKGEDIFQKG